MNAAQRVASRQRHKEAHEQRLPFTYEEDEEAAQAARRGALCDDADGAHAPSPRSNEEGAAVSGASRGSCDHRPNSFTFDTVNEALIPQHDTSTYWARSGGVPTSTQRGDGSKLSASALRARIRAIGEDRGLSAEERDRVRQQLYTNGYSARQRAAEEEYRARALAQKYVRGHSQHVDAHTGRRLAGCEHYARNCKILAPCCAMWVVCRHCHNVPAVTASHEMNRFKVRRILCTSCWTEQGVGARCVNAGCGERFARYFCAKCNFYDNTPGKQIYHCDKCRICRVGRDNYHCDTCNACVSLGDGEGHRCLRSSLDTNCPICSGYMLTSISQVVFMQCGHAMHLSCFEEYTSHNYVCPICSKSLTDMAPYYEQIDEVVASQTLPREYERRKLEVLCHDCDVRSVTRFHFLYHKCVKCAGYNTRLIGDRAVDEQIRVLSAADRAN